MVTYLGVLPAEASKAACADPAALPLIDAAFARSGGAEAKQLRRQFCSYCEIAERCLTAALVHPEPGVWGGTSSNLRTRARTLAKRAS